MKKRKANFATQTDFLPYVFRTDEANKEETSKCNLQLYPYKFRLDNCLRLKPLIYDSQSHAY